MGLARRAALAVVAASALAACGGSNTPPPPKAPSVTLSPVPREIVATAFSVTVGVTGCTKVQKVWLTDRGSILAQQDGGGVTNTLSVLAKNVDYKSLGVPADLALFAHATCDNGLTGDSDEQATTFMPAAEVIKGELPFGKNFWVEEDSATVLTCDTQMRKVGKDKSVLGGFQLPFDCGFDADLTFGADGTRYLLKPGTGFVGFTAAMQQTVGVTSFPAEQLVAPPSGPVAVLGKEGILYQVRGYDRATGAVAWAGAASDALPAGRMVVNRLGQIVFPGYKQETGTEFVNVGIELYDAQKGLLLADRVFGKIKVDPMLVTPFPALSFDQTAEIAYFAEIANPSHVWACSAITDAPCTDLGGGLKWKSTALPGGVIAVTRLANTLVAFGDKVAYFLDPATGASLTSTTTPIAPQGSLVFVAAVGGGDGSTYLLAMARDASGRLLPGVREILIFDKPGRQVADYLTLLDGFIVDVDKSGRAWLWRYDLTTLMLPSDYRQALGL